MSLPAGTYRIESVAFDETPKRVLDLKDGSPEPYTIIRAYPDHGGPNQQWHVYPSDENKNSYLFRAVFPPSYLYVDANGTVGNPKEGTEFKLLKVGGPKTPNQFQIYIEFFETKIATNAPDDKEEQVKGAILVPGDKHQTWRFVPV